MVSNGMKLTGGQRNCDIKYQARFSLPGVGKYFLNKRTTTDDIFCKCIVLNVESITFSSLGLIKLCQS